MVICLFTSIVFALALNPNGAKMCYFFFFYLVEGWRYLFLQSVSLGALKKIKMFPVSFKMGSFNWEHSNYTPLHRKHLFISWVDIE